MYETLKERTREILAATKPDDRASQIFQIFIITLIILNVTVVVLATVETLRRRYGTFYRLFETFSVVVFTIEYVLRVWSCTAEEKYSHPVTGRLRFMVTPAALVDLVAIVPFFIPRLTNIDLRAVRALRIFRLFRLLKLGRFSSSIDVFSDVLSQKKEQMIVAAFAVVILLVFSSSAMYFVEKRVQPDHFSSIPATMWWGVITLTAVGYGNVYPITTLGKVLGGIICFLGIGIFALPAGILASGFQEALNRRMGSDDDNDEEEDERDKPKRPSVEDLSEHNFCPCCGQRLHDEKDSGGRSAETG